MQSILDHTSSFKGSCYLTCINSRLICNSGIVITTFNREARAFKREVMLLVKPAVGGAHDEDSVLHLDVALDIK